MIKSYSYNKNHTVLLKTLMRINSQNFAWVKKLEARAAAVSSGLENFLTLNKAIF